jgi:hypothetical protein
LSAESVARTTTKLTPMLREMLQEKAPPDTVVATPSQVIEETPDRASDTVPEILTLEVVKALPSVGEVTASTGMVLSMLRVTLAAAVSPFTSVAVPLMT